jgi:hypothetical protein
MLMTDSAMLDAEHPKASLLTRWSLSLQRFFGLADADGDAGDLEATSSMLEPVDHTTAEPALRVLHVEPEIARAASGLRWRRHPLLLRQSASDLSSDERGARHEAVRGLFAARAGALDVATVHFTRAAQCPDIDLSDIPGFWQLTRSAMTTAVDAYEAAGRIREASALNARIRTMYRPRALSSVPTNVTPLPERPSRISSNS